MVLVSHFFLVNFKLTRPRANPPRRNFHFEKSRNNQLSAFSAIQKHFPTKKVKKRIRELAKGIYKRKKIEKIAEF